MSTIVVIILLKALFANRNPRAVVDAIVFIYKKKSRERGELCIKKRKKKE